MQLEYIKINILEARNFIESKQRIIRDLETELVKEKNILKKIISIVNNHDQTKMKWTINIPVELISDNLKTENIKINWKKMVYDLMQKYDIPMTTELLYNKLMITNNSILCERRFAIKNISSALYYLATVDNKIFRTKLNNKEYVYGLKHHFNFNNNLKSSFSKEFKREIGKEEKD